MSDNPGFLERLREEQMTQGPEEIPVDPTHPNYAEVSGEQSSLASQVDRGMQDGTLIDLQQQHYYDDSIIMFAMEAVNGIKGLEFESYEDWEQHVDRVVAKIKANRS